MTLKIVETRISGSSIHMRLADRPDSEMAKEIVEISIPLSAQLALPTPNGDIPLGELATRQLASIQLAALRYVRDAIGEETHRLASLSRT